MGKRKKSYKASGKVYGKYWGGGEGIYEAREYESDTLEELEDKINKDVKTGAIDGGMGYEEVLGAYMIIDIITDIEIDGKIFSNVKIEKRFYGKLTDEQKDFLGFGEFEEFGEFGDDEDM